MLHSRLSPLSHQHYGECELHERTQEAFTNPSWVEPGNRIGRWTEGQSGEGREGTHFWFIWEPSEGLGCNTQSLKDFLWFHSIQAIGKEIRIGVRDKEDQGKKKSLESKGGFLGRFRAHSDSRMKHSCS